jgi:hypothetical protein
VTLQFGASLTDDTRIVNYDRNTFIIQATVLPHSFALEWQSRSCLWHSDCGVHIDRAHMHFFLNGVMLISIFGVTILNVIMKNVIMLSILMQSV